MRGLFLCASRVLLKQGHIATKNVFKPQLITPIRGIRIKSTSSNEEKHHDKSKKESNDQGPEMPSGMPKLNPEQLQNLRKKVLIGYAILSTGMLWVTYTLMKPMLKPPKDMEGVDWVSVKESAIGFNEFLERYLPSGEIKSIVILGGANLMVLTLHDGAVIQGKAVTNHVVGVKLDETLGNGQEVERMIRQKEDTMQIIPGQGIQIRVIQGPSLRRLLELVVGLGIIVFLMTQYGKVIARKQALNFAKKATKK
uniref:DUF1279 domain-containing protein n=1 Tax=Rhabditophanes sp. KR3021 TaxID=114890 RepID=A0AC35TQZ1_9BILA